MQRKKSVLQQMKNTKDELGNLYSTEKQPLWWRQWLLP